MVNVSTPNAFSSILLSIPVDERNEGGHAVCRLIARPVAQQALYREFGVAGACLPRAAAIEVVILCAAAEVVVAPPPLVSPSWYTSLSSLVLVFFKTPAPFTAARMQTKSREQTSPFARVC